LEGKSKGRGVGNKRSMKRRRKRRRSTKSRRNRRHTRSGRSRKSRRRRREQARQGMHCVRGHVRLEVNVGVRMRARSKGGTEASRHLSSGAERGVDWCYECYRLRRNGKGRVK